MTTPASPRVDQDPVAFWNGPAAQRWIDFREMLDAEMGPFGEAAADAAAVGAGEIVLDVGCGCGTTALDLARRVGSGGRVIGVDVSAPMVEVARQRTAEAGLANVEFVAADAATIVLEPRFDLIYSRFGWMFFVEPVAAFAHLRSLASPGGRLAWIGWRALAENTWAALPLAAITPVIGAPAPFAPGAPGPFAFADPSRAHQLLADAGWRDVRVSPVDRTVSIGAGRGLEAAVDHATAIGPTARALADAGAGDKPELRERARSAIRDALRPYARGGTVELPAAAWLVTATTDAG